MRASAAFVWPAALIAIASPPEERETLWSRSVSSIGDSISVSEFGISEIDQLAIAGGRYLWVSGPRQGIAVIDLLTGNGATIGRAGSGPGEYRMVSHVFGCEDDAGFVDDQLQRVTWVGTAGRSEPRSIQIPSGVLSRAKTQTAWCDHDSLWIAVERQGTPASGARIDSLEVIRIVRSSLQIETVAKFQGSERHLRSKGALRTSLRLPYVTPPLLIRKDGQLVVIGRSTDSLWIFEAGGRRGNAIVGDRAPRVLVPRHLQTVRDSISGWYEAEMESQRYDPALRREFRTLIAELLPAVKLPAALPLVKLATAGPRGISGLFVAENDYPASRQTCIATLALSGHAKRVLCRTWADRTVGAIQASADGVWFAQWNDNGAWVMRIRVPSRP
jgi:hypothetical protein